MGETDMFELGECGGKSSSFSSSLSSPMNQNKKYKKEICSFHITKKNKIRKIVKEIYFRDDISCCIQSCPSCVSLNHLPILSCVDEENEGIFDELNEKEGGEENVIGENGEEREKGEKGRIIILDTNVILHQIDFLMQNNFIQNVVILDSVLKAVRRRSLQIYSKILTLCDASAKMASSTEEPVLVCKNDEKNEEKNEENKNAEEKQNRRFAIFPNEFLRETFVERNEDESIEEREERAVRVSCIWYANHILQNFQMQPNVLLLTQHITQKEKALESGIDCMTIYEFAESVKSLFPHAAEQLAILRNDADDIYMEEDDFSPAVAAISKISKTKKDAEKFKNDKNDNFSIPEKIKKKAVYPSHLNDLEVQRGIKQKLYFQGTLRMKRGTCFKATVLCRGIEKEVTVNGRLHLNRAIDGDFVAVELLKENDKKKEKIIKKEEEKEKEKEKNEEEKTEEKEEEKEYEVLIDSTYKEDDQNQLQTFIEENIEEEVLDEFDGEILRSEEGHSGRVVAVLKRNTKEFCGTIQSSNYTKNDGYSHMTENRIFIPSDVRIPFISLKTRNSHMLENKRIVVVIDSWDRYSKYPSGHWISIMGDVGDLDVESAVILKDFDVITREFSEAVLKCLPPADWEITEEVLAGRLDMRGKLICSIDPPGCKDIDDALSIEKLPNGNFLVGVHIADVTHFVRSGTAIDEEAARRCTTVYLVDRRTDMLPSLLTTDLCSLVGGKERLAFSVLWEVNENCEIQNKIIYTKSVIKSQAALTYAQAQDIIDDPNNQSELAEGLRQLNKLTKILRKRRMECGALELASLEVRFQLDSETKDPTDVALYQIKETNHLVEELMLLANISVAEFILLNFPFYSVLRKHPPPKIDCLESLQNILKKSGYEEFAFDTSKSLSNSLNKIRSKKDFVFDKILRILTTRCMNQARYICSGNIIDRESYHHYGLSCSIYTHFTSPIRRYADVLVHRLLSAALYKQTHQDEQNAQTNILYQTLPAELTDKNWISEECDLMNDKNLNAREASRAAIKFYTYIFFKKHGGCLADAVVVQVGKTFASIILPKFGIESVVFLPEDVFTYQSEKSRITKKSDQNFSLQAFDRISVKIFAQDKNFRFTTVMEFVDKLDKLKTFYSEKAAQDFREVRRKILENQFFNEDKT